MSTMGGKSSSLAFWSVSDRQMRPRPYLAMKLMLCGVTFSAARQKSPSLSGSFPSARITILPARMSSMACSMEIWGIKGSKNRLKFEG